MSKKEERTNSAVKKGYEAFDNSFNCAQSSLAGLMREFLPEDPSMDALLSAALPMPGVGSRGETCGTVQGSLMFLGRLYHKDMTKKKVPMQAPPEGVRGMGIPTEVADKFAEKMGSTQCNVVHTKVMGKQYDLLDSKEVMKFYVDGASYKCQEVVETAIRIVCDLIMDENGEIIGLN